MAKQKTDEVKKPRITQRIAARIVDQILVQLAVGAIFFLLNRIIGDDPSDLVVYASFGLYLLMSLIYYIYFTYKFDGATIGKKMAKLKVVSQQGKLSLRQIIIRYVSLDFMLDGLIFLLTTVVLLSTKQERSLEALLYIMTALVILFDKRGRGYHDFIAGTVVVKS